MTDPTTASAGTPDSVPADHLAEVLALHFHPEHGSRFWLERAALLPFDPTDRIRSVEDLPLLGVMVREDFTGRSVLDFVPAALHGELPGMMLSDTGGTTGRPIRCVYAREEFEEGFVRPFAVAARARGFGGAGSWLFVGPSGPHVIHRAARAFARDAGALEPFGVDFDPRWARAQTPGTIGARAYVGHVIAQALDVCSRECVSVLFSTPPVLTALADRMSEEARTGITSIHVGGMALEASHRATLAAAFPAAVILPAYGNSLAGIAPEMSEPTPGAGPAYAVPRGRMRLRVVLRPQGDVFDAAALARTAALGERGRVVLDRVDRTFLVANLVERDDACTAPAPEWVRDGGFQDRLVVDPALAAEVPVSGGLY